MTIPHASLNGYMVGRKFRLHTKTNTLPAGALVWVIMVSNLGDVGISRRPHSTSYEARVDAADLEPLDPDILAVHKWVQQAKADASNAVLWDAIWVRYVELLDERGVKLPDSLGLCGGPELYFHWSCDMEVWNTWRDSKLNCPLDDPKAFEAWLVNEQ